MIFIWVIFSGGPPKLADDASDKLPPPSTPFRNNLAAMQR